jgi:hypothetical protein
MPNQNCRRPHEENTQNLEYFFTPAVIPWFLGKEVTAKLVGAAMAIVKTHTLAQIRVNAILI